MLHMILTITLHSSFLVAGESLKLTNRVKLPKEQHYLKIGKPTELENTQYQLISQSYRSQKIVLFAIFGFLSMRFFFSLLVHSITKYKNSRLICLLFI